MSCAIAKVNELPRKNGFFQPKLWKRRFGLYLATVASLKAHLGIGCAVSQNKGARRVLIEAPTRQILRLAILATLDRASHFDIDDSRGRGYACEVVIAGQECGN